MSYCVGSDLEYSTIEKRDNFVTASTAAIIGFVNAAFLYNISKIVPTMFGEKAYITKLLAEMPILKGMVNSLSSSFTKGSVEIGNKWHYDAFSLSGVDSNTLYSRVERTKGLYGDITVAATFMYLTIMKALSKDTFNNLGEGGWGVVKSITKALFVGGVTQAIEEIAKSRFKVSSKRYPFASTLLSSTLLTIPRNIFIAMHPQSGLAGMFSSMVKFMFAAKKAYKTAKSLKPGDKKTGLKAILKKQNDSLENARSKIEQHNDK